jgi:regulator of replication initiation timing
MKITYIILYLLSGAVFMFAYLGSNITKPYFDSISEKVIESSGFKKSYIQSVDDKIDELVYKSKQIELQIEKIKSFFSSDQIDENKYKKEKSEMLQKTFYDPLVNLFDLVFRIAFIFISVLIFFAAIVFHLAERSLSLRKRIRKLEEIVYGEKSGYKTINS